MSATSATTCSPTRAKKPAELVLVNPDGSARVVGGRARFSQRHGGDAGRQDPDRRRIDGPSADGVRCRRRRLAERTAGCGPTSARRVPDGIALDAENAIWVASPLNHELLRVKQGGAVDRSDQVRLDADRVRAGRCGAPDAIRAVRRQYPSGRMPREEECANRYDGSCGRRRRLAVSRNEMGYTKTIVCLANSRKPPSGRCVAGREVASVGFGAWIRPISERPTLEISEEERRYQDGTDPKVLDIIAIEMKRALPEHHQQENHLIDDGYYWVKRGVVSWRDLQAGGRRPCRPALAQWILQLIRSQ